MTDLEQEFYDIQKDNSNFGYEEDYFKLKDLNYKMLSEIERLNNKLNKIHHDIKYGAELIYAENVREFIPILTPMIGVTHNGKRPEAFTLNFNPDMLENWFRDLEVVCGGEEMIDLKQEKLDDMREEMLQENYMRKDFEYCIEQLDELTVALDAVDTLTKVVSNYGWDMSMDDMLEKLKDYR